MELNYYSYMFNQSVIWRNNSMLIVQYPVQFSGPPRNISNPCMMFSIALRRRMVVQLTQLGLMHYYYPLSITEYCPEYHIYFMVEDRDIHNFYHDRELTPGKTTARRLETT